MGIQRFKDCHLVIDFGSKLCKVGFSGDLSPRAILIVNLECVAGSVGDQMKILCKQIRKEIVVSNDCRSAAICERINIPVKIKEEFVRALFNEFHLDSINLYPSAILALLPVVKSSGLVIDVGNVQINVCPVYDNTLLATYHTSLIFQHDLGSEDGDKDNINEDPVNSAFDYRGEESLPSIILQCLSKCPIDIRRELVSNIILVGGGACIFGVREQISHQTNQLAMVSKKFKFMQKILENWSYVEYPFNSSILEWVGCSLVEEFPIIRGLNVKRSDTKVPDWAFSEF